MNKRQKMLNRASKITFYTPYKKLRTISEKQYIEKGLDNLLENNIQRGGYGGKFATYILIGGKKPRRIK